MEIVKFETAKLAKEKGFDWRCDRWYVNDVRFGNLGDLKRFYYKGNDQMNFAYFRSYAGYQPHLILAPTQSQLQNWLRKEKNIDILIVPERYETGTNYLVQAQLFDFESKKVDSNYILKATPWYNDNNEYPTFEKALEKILFEALKLIQGE